LKSGLSENDVEAVMSGELPGEDRARAIVEATRLVLDRRGWLDASDLQSLEAKGISRAQLYEIIAYVGAKTITNYVNHIARTEVDPAFSAAAELPAYRAAVAAEAE
jgi:alkylhydroperoxidase family enzyme